MKKLKSILIITFLFAIGSVFATTLLKEKKPKKFINGTPCWSGTPGNCLSGIADQNGCILSATTNCTMTLMDQVCFTVYDSKNDCGIASRILKHN